MLFVYTRHYPPCPQTDIHYRRCHCPKWIRGRLEEEGLIRRSAHTRNWSRAGYQRSLRKLFRMAALCYSDGSPKPCRSHMFRDTFAVELLLAGVPIDQVSALLGHRSIKMTEKHYLPWVKARQTQLTASVRRAWFAEVRKVPPATAEGKSEKEQDGLRLLKRPCRLVGVHGDVPATDQPFFRYLYRARASPFVSLAENHYQEVLITMGHISSK